MTDTIYNKIKDRIKLKHQLTAIKESNNKYELSFSNNKNTIKIKADYLILALPYSVLRTIKMDVAMPAEKRAKMLWLLFTFEVWFKKVYKNQ